MNNSRIPSEKSFGLLFLTIAAGFALYGLYKGWSGYVVLALFLGSLAFGLTTLLCPRVLAPLNKAWFFLGQSIGKIVSPIVLGILFYGLLTPIALVAKVFGRDELKLKFRQVDSYWVERKPPGPSASSFKNQF